MKKKEADEMVLKFENFLKFDTVDDFSDHYYRKHACAAKLVCVSPDMGICVTLNLQLYLFFTYISLTFCIGTKAMVEENPR